MLLILEHRPTKQSLVVIVILALLFATVFAMSQTFAAKVGFEKSMLAKTIICNPVRSQSKNNLPRKNDGGGCPHMGTCILVNSGNKRHKTQSC